MTETDPHKTPVIHFVLKLVQSFITYAKHLESVLPTKARHPDLAKFTVEWASRDLSFIMQRVHRGLLRAMLLQKFLLLRAKTGRDLRDGACPEPATPEAVEAFTPNLREKKAGEKPARRKRDLMDMPLIADPETPNGFYLESVEEMWRQIRRRSIGRTLADIALDLAATPGTIDYEFWRRLERAMRYIHDNVGVMPDGFTHYHYVRDRRRRAVNADFERISGVWPGDVWDAKPRETVRGIIGWLLGEAGPEPQPG